MEFFKNEKVILLNHHEKGEFLVKIEGKQKLYDKVIYDFSYNNGMDYGFTYKEFLKSEFKNV